MADQKVSAMPNAAVLTGAELIPVVQGGGNFKASVTTILQAIGNIITLMFSGLHFIFQSTTGGLFFSDSNGNFGMASGSSKGAFQFDVDGNPEVITGLGVMITGDTATGNLLFPNLPTADPGVSGAMWNSAGTLKISP